MAKSKKISNTTAVLVALGALIGVQVAVILDKTDMTPMALIVGVCMAIGYWFAHTIRQFRKGLSDKDQAALMSKNVGGFLVILGLPLIFSGDLQFQIFGVLIAGIGLTSFR